MEDKLTNQEEQFRDLSENFSLEIDTSELWDNVEARLPIQKKSKRPIIWWFLAGALVPVFGFLVWYNISNSNTNLEPKLLAPSVDKLESIETTDEISKHTKNTPSKELVKDPIASKIPINSSVSTDLKPIVKSTIPQSIQKKNTPINEYTRYDEKSTSQKEVIDQSQGTEESFVATLVDPSVSVDEKITEDENTSAEEIITKREILMPFYAEILMPDALESELNNVESIASFMQIEPMKITYWKPYFAISSGVNLNRNNIYSGTTENFNNDQFESEKSLPGFTSSIKFGHENNSGWRYGVGLDLHRVVNRFHQKETLYTTKDINGVESYKIDDDGNTISTEGLITETTITNYDLKWHRKHDFVNVQLSLGKRLIQSGRFTLFVDANISKNIWSQHSGYYFKENEVVISRFEQGQNHPYTNAGFGLGSSLSFEYNMNNLSFSLSPFALKGLNSMMEKNNYYQNKNSHYGIQLGIVYRP